jgi:predicted peroxiredoxin
MRTSLIAALLALSLVVPFAGASRAQDADGATLVINLTSDDVWTQQMALGLGRNYMSATGNDLVVFLNLRAVGIASAQVPQHTTALTGKTPQALLAALIADGARVFLCTSCTKQAGLTADDRIEGVEPSSPAYLEILSAPGTRVVSY